MSWVRLDDNFPDHPKVIGLPSAAKWLYISTICYANRHLTDGFLSDAALAGMHERRWATKLCNAQLWERVEGGFRIHDYLEWQRSRAKTDEDRQKDSARKRNGVRTDSKRNPKGFHPLEESREEKSRVAAAEAAATEDSARSAAAAAAAAEVSPELRRAFTAWEQQSPGGLLKPIADHLADALEAYPVEWIEAACRSAAENGGYKPWKYIDSTLQRMKREGGASSRRQSNGAAPERDPYADFKTPELSPELAAIVRASQEDADGGT